MPNAPATVLYKWFHEVWNNQNESAIDTLFHADGIAHDLGGENDLKGPEGFKTFYQSFRNRFKDVHVEVNEVIREDDFESALCTVSATEKESGKPVKFKGICMARIVDHKIAEAWNSFDFLEMYKQLGVLANANV